MTPPKYPRIAHLVRRAGVGSDDLVVGDETREALLAADVVVEEKLDGANVTIWLDDGVPTVATRGGPDTMDRSGRRGRVRAWAAQRADALRTGLGDGLALYGEWLLTRHTVRYDRLPAALVGLDVLDRSTGVFLATSARDDVLARAGVIAPPCRFSGRLGSVERATALIGVSAFSAGRAEGIVIRPRLPGADLPRLAKLVRPDWQPISDAEWERPGRRANVVAG